MYTVRIFMKCTHVCSAQNAYLLFTTLLIKTDFPYNPFLVYCRELAPGTVSLTGDRAQGDDSKHDSHLLSR